MIKKLINYWKEKDLSLYSSVIITCIFALYNAYVGFKHNAIWNMSIAVYYIILLLLKGISLKEEKNSNKMSKPYSKRIFLFLATVTILLTLVMIGPAILMLEYQRKVTFSLITAIAIATYTTYKVIISIKKYLAFKKDKSLFNRQNAVINIISAVMSVLTLQNTLISIKNEQSSESMLILSIISTITMLVVISIIAIKSLLNGIKQNTNSLSNNLEKTN